MARRRYQLSRCPECGTSGMSVTTEEQVGHDGQDGSDWVVVGAECVHGCQVPANRVRLPV